MAMISQHWYIRLNPYSLRNLTPLNLFYRCISPAFIRSSPNLQDVKRYQ
ncbi:hypothetical protein [Nostoc sp.]